MSCILRVIGFAVIGVPILLSSPVSAQDIRTPARAVPQLRTPGVQPGDRVMLTLYNQNGEKLNDIGGERTVDVRGLLYLPFLEEVDVQGMSQESLREHLADAYEAFYANSVVEVVVEYRVNVTGAVRDPGPYFLTPNSTLADLMASAGGAQSEVDVGLQGGAADASRVRLTRRGYEHPFILNFRPMEANAEVINAPIQSGDWLHVPTARQSQLREDILFAGNILAVLIAGVSLVLLIR